MGYKVTKRGLGAGEKDTSSADTEEKARGVMLRDPGLQQVEG